MLNFLRRERRVEYALGGAHKLIDDMKVTLKKNKPNLPSSVKMWQSLIFYTTNVTANHSCQRQSRSSSETRAITSGKIGTTYDTRPKVNARHKFIVLILLVVWTK